MTKEDFESQCKLLCEICTIDLDTIRLKYTWYHVSYFFVRLSNRHYSTNISDAKCQAGILRNLYAE